MSLTRRIIRGYWFLGAMGGMIALSHFAGAGGRFLDEHGASKGAIIGLFLLSGIALSLRSVNRIVSNWRVHTAIQATVFVVIPATVYFTSFWMEDGPLRYGVLLLAVLPTTIGSSSAFTVAAGGNGLLAMVNAAGSNMMGIVLSPLLLGLMLRASGPAGVGGMGQAGRTMLSMCWQVLAPFAVGQFLAMRFPELREKLRGMQSILAQGLVLLLSYCAFSKSIDELAGQIGPMWKTFAYLAAVQAVFTVVSVQAARALRFDAEDRPALTFCATQKTMAFGIPIAYSFFKGSDAPMAVIIAPLVFYYLFQMLTGSLAVQFYLRRNVDVRHGPRSHEDSKDDGTTSRRHS